MIIEQGTFNQLPQNTCHIFQMLRLSYTDIEIHSINN